MQKLQRYLPGKIAENFNLFLLFQSVLIVLFIFQIWVEAFYLSEPFETKIGWKAEDGKGIKYPAGIGSHYFSDYSYMVDAANSSNPWDIPNNYTPFAVLIFKMFGYLPSDLGLFSWILGSLILLLIPLLSISKQKFSSSQRILISVIYILSAPMLATLDRGNQIAALPLILLFFYITFQSRLFKAAGIILGIAVSIKIYPLILVFLLLKSRNWISIAWMFLTTTVLNLTALFFYDSPLEKLKGSSQGVLSHNALAVEPQPMIFSAAGILHNMAHLFNNHDGELALFIRTNSLAISIVMLLMVTLISIKKYENFAILPYLYCLQLLPLQSYTYSRIWSLAGLLILLKAPSCNLKRIWMTIIGLNISPFSIWINGEVNLLPSMAVMIFILTVVAQLAVQINPRLLKRNR